MTTKTLSTYAAAGYTLLSKYSGLLITSTGGVGGTGLHVNFYAKVYNDGRVTASAKNYGMYLADGGYIRNGGASYLQALITGYAGIVANGATALVSNFGSISGSYAGGVVLERGGLLINGSEGDTTATISSKTHNDVFSGGELIVNNYGTIQSFARGFGIITEGGGDIYNGQSTDTHALIEGAFGGAVLYESGKVTNFGAVDGGSGAGVAMYGGLITNGGGGDFTALIEGAEGVTLGQAGAGASSATVVNFGTVMGSAGYGVKFDVAGSVANGAATDPFASISGVRRGVSLSQGGTVANFGLIAATGATSNDCGIYMGEAGRLTNGAASDLNAGVIGYTGVSFSASGTVVNYGTIGGLAVTATSAGIYLAAGGSVINGQGSDRTALIEGANAVVVQVSAGTVKNLGTLLAPGLGIGATLAAGGAVTNGSASDKSALIQGYSGVVMGAAATVTNYGTVDGVGVSAYLEGVSLAAGGTVINGSGTDRTALIEGAVGVSVSGAPGTIRNGGTILGDYIWGAQMSDGGLIANGSLNNPTAVIQGYSGLYLNGGSATNLGVVSGVGDRSIGVDMAGGASVTNGAAGHAGALIESYVGVYLLAGQIATVTNYGTILGAGGRALVFNTAADTLVVESGCAFEGAVEGGGGALVLASGVGTLGGSGVGQLTVSGSMATTTFTGFGSLAIGAAATFTDPGAVAIGAGQTLSVAGELSVGGAAATIANAGVIAVSGAGTLTLDGAVSGAGAAIIAGGTLSAISTFSQNVTFSGTSGELQLAKSQGYRGSITGFSKTGGESLDLSDIAFVGSAEATFSGTTKGGTLTVTDGTHTARINLKGNYTKSTFVTSSDGLGGTIVVDPRTRLGHAPPDLMIAAMARLGARSGGGIHGIDVPALHEPMFAAPRAATA
jgi:hypothetical protein